MPFHCSQIADRRAHQIFQEDRKELGSGAKQGRFSRSYKDAKGAEVEERSLWMSGREGRKSRKALRGKQVT